MLIGNHSVEVDDAVAPLRNADIGQADFQLLIDVRRFSVAVDSDPTAVVALSARIVDKEGKVITSRVFEESETLEKFDPRAAASAFDNAFGRVANNMIIWATQSL